MPSTFSYILVTCLIAAALFASTRTADAQADAPDLTLDQYRELRKEAAWQDRRIIFNNDGSEVFLFPGDREITPENVLELRTSALADSDVDAIFYNASTPSFGMVTHYSEVFDLRDYFEQRHIDDGKVNATWPLIEQGSDSLQTMVDFSHDNDMEIFLSMRMNDTHDAGRHSSDSPNPTFAPLKRKHPEYLVGSHDDRPPFGRWSAVDYAHAEVRDLAYRYLEEVCQNYDVDGIELDFFRHYQIFKSVLWGADASQDQLDLMTDFIRRVREMTEREGRKRGRPILLAVRAPDSVAFCRKIGIDLERWMAEGLIDIYIPTGYFRLNHWEHSVALGHRYDIPVYPCFSESRVRPDRGRNGLESYRARAASAWNAGADGVYLFNMFNPEHPMLETIGSPDKLAGTDKVYYVSVRGDSGGANPGNYANVKTNPFQYPIVTPASPATLRSEPVHFDLHVAEDFQRAADAGAQAEVTLRLLVPGAPSPDLLQVSLNDHSLESVEHDPPYLDYTVDPAQLRQGLNRLELAINEATDDRTSLSFRSAAPTSGNQLVMTDLEVDTPDPHSLRLRMKAAATGEATIGSFSIRTPNKGDTDPVPPGFKKASNEYIYPEAWSHPGFFDGGRHDEDDEDDAFTITLPMENGQPGSYTILAIVQNRPDPGQYYRDDRTVSFYVDEDGRVRLPYTLQDVQLHVTYSR